jgi:hypothetical protein
MKHLALIELAVPLVASALLAKDDRVWATGTVLDSQTFNSYLATGSTTVSRTSSAATAVQAGPAIVATGNANQTSTTRIDYLQISDTQLLILGLDYQYVVDDPVVKRKGVLSTAIANRKHGCRFIIGDPMLYIDQGGTLALLDADGKECKLKVVKQKRIPRDASAPPTQPNQK